MKLSKQIWIYLKSFYEKRPHVNYSVLEGNLQQGDFIQGEQVLSALVSQQFPLEVLP